MSREQYTVSRKKRYLLYAVMLLCFLCVCIPQFVGNNKQKGISEAEITYQGSFVWEKSDGNSVSIHVPDKFEVPAKETMTIVTQLPENYLENALAIRSSLQSVRFYVDGELRAEYDTSKTRLFGKNSASSYVFCQTSAADAGKEVRIELQSNTKKYSGVVNTVYCGDTAEIWEYLFQAYGLETVIGFFLLFAGAITIVFSLLLGIVYRTKFDLEYLGWCVVIAAGWMIGESKMRQLFLPNPTALSTLCFVMILLSPVAISYYIDMLEKGRHRKLFSVLEDIAFVNLLVCSALHFLGIADYIETLPLAHVILVTTVAFAITTMFYDMKKQYVEGNRYILAGIVVAIVVVLIESISAYLVVSISGIFIGTGMLVLLLANLIRTIQIVKEIENRRHREELEERRRQMEKMSLQLMQTLSMTIEAKDEYRRGHSYRVAEYAALIAKELGWDENEIRNLKNASYLHDIGYIGIPDMILNKPTKLTEEEYGVIKEHTIIGSEILKNITLIDHVREVARSHHERYDGAGYPDGLKGEEIPLIARIVMVAESYDAMQSRRIYRNPLDEKVIYNEFLNNRGLQFDPEITDVILELLNENRMIIKDYGTADREDPLNAEIEIEKFISDVMVTIKTQEDSEGLDFLTGLPMRNRGEKLAAQFMQQDDGYLVFMDMDNLKIMNDIYGHKTGDRALKLLGTLLMEHAHHSVVCRLGGDEFLMFVPGVSKEEITGIVAGIQNKFEQSKENDVEIRCASVSAGICAVNKGDSFEECYSKADKALYHVKRNEKGNYFFYQQVEGEKLLDQGAGRDLIKVAKALRSSGKYSGALDLDYREFAKIYEYMKQLEVRYKYQCYLVMVTMETAPDTVAHIENIEQALECMQQAIKSKVRKVDAYTRYSSMQYLIILFETEEGRIAAIMDRIFEKYHSLYAGNNLIPKYEYISMTDAAEN